MTASPKTHTVDEIRHGLPLENDLPIAERPDIADMRDGVNIWFFEENGDFAFPRIAVDAVGDRWEIGQIGANLAFADGRTLLGDGGAPAISPIDENGKPTIRGCTDLSFRCVEPFRRWQMTCDHEFIDGTSEQQIAGQLDPSKKARVRVNAEFELHIPVWSQYFADDDTSSIAGWMGRGWRYETPVTIAGTLEIDGRERAFRGNGNLIRRKSRRATAADFPGHSWHAARFPDGRAFGINAYPPKEGETELSYNTGYIYQDGQYYDAQVVDAPWLRRMVTKGDDCSLTIKSALGLTRIHGETLLSTFRPGYVSMGGLCLHQGAVRYTWDDQTVIGMTERSSYLNKA